MYFLLNVILISLFFNSIITKKIQLLSYNEETFSNEYKNLINFVKSNNGYINPKLIPNEISKTNRYIITKEKIKNNEILLYIPDQILISKLHKLIHSKCQDAYGINEENE